MNQEAAKAVIKARTQMIYRQRFYSCLALNLEPKESPAAASTAFEGKSYFYNADYILGLTEGQRMGSWAQAVTGCVYKHPMRRKWRDPRRWSLACAYVINHDVLSAGFELPPGSVTDAKYLGMSAEQVYEMLDEQDEQSKPKPPEQGGDETAPKKGGGGGKPDEKGDDGEGESDGDGEGGQGQGGRTPQQEHDPGGAGEVLDATDHTDVNGNKEASDEWDKNVRAAMAVAKAANAGSVPGELERIYKTLTEPRIDWRDVTRIWAQNSMRKDTSWSRPDKRYLPRKIYLPGKVSDRPHRLAVIGDTSGSMTPRLWSELATEIKAMVDEGVADEVYVIYTDTKFQGVDIFEAYDELKLNPKGGGGTHFKAVWEWLEQNVDDVAGVIFFTDLLTLDFGLDPGCPVLWAVHGDKRRYAGLASKAPFGDTVFVDYT